jgi:hypothetical protein
MSALDDELVDLVRWGAARAFAARCHSGTDIAVVAASVAMTAGVRIEADVNCRPPLWKTG